ncbi:MAG: hypothetical protein GY714_10575 [Desulfobacterales bacterium]|nr:hypothetical protein [Desulfobacterales bacterium]
MNLSKQEITNQIIEMVHEIDANSINANIVIKSGEEFMNDITVNTLFSDICSITNDKLDTIEINQKQAIVLISYLQKWVIKSS